MTTKNRRADARTEAEDPIASRSGSSIDIELLSEGKDSRLDDLDADTLIQDVTSITEEAAEESLKQFLGRRISLPKSFSRYSRYIVIRPAPTRKEK